MRLLPPGRRRRPFLVWFTNNSTRLLNRKYPPDGGYFFRANTVTASGVPSPLVQPTLLPDLAGLPTLLPVPFSRRTVTVALGSVSWSSSTIWNM